MVGDFDVAEEAVQEAFAAAVDQWCAQRSRISTSLIIQTA
jgi:predicted RNA polymerase sigma factor